HAQGADCVDLLLMDDGFILELHAPRIDTKNTHGTGCTLSASIAAGLAKGFTLDDAVRLAHHYLQGAIGAADDMGIGSGHGPVHHFHQTWT
ncbi:MAG: bifunctional hydroxymethylpyrimidine kinase/phosphomethylpyrimidine kinase, partial [Rhodospirillales bacterium]